MKCGMSTSMYRHLCLSPGLWSSLHRCVHCPNFTDYIYLCGDPCEAKQINRFAKTFYAVARAVRTTLREHYRFLRLQGRLESRALLVTQRDLSSSKFASSLGTLVFEEPVRL
jgi:hypothetical protein